MFTGKPFLIESRHQVDLNGNIVLPLVGKLHVAGLTSDQVSALIDRAFVPKESERLIVVTRCQN